MASAEDTLRAAYRAFNARDISAAVELMHPEVDWPNAWEGGRVVGHEAVHQVVRNAQTDEVQADTHVLHHYRLKDGLIARMDVLDAAL